jgi:SAM-dependent methyltransferase
MNTVARRFAAAVTLAVALILSTRAPGAQTQPQSSEQVRERWNAVFQKGAPTLNREPSPLLVGAVRQRKPGKALDLGTGQGRNAVFLASQGWTVTGVDISGVAIAEAKKNAATRKVQIDAIVGDLDAYDFGREQWDLITSFYMHSWHHRSPTDVPARIHDALRPGGLLVMEGFAKPDPPFGFSVEELSKAYGRLRILKNESVNTNAEWDKDNKATIVRFVGEKAK